MADLKEPRVHLSKTLFVRNLPYSTTDEVLESVFSPYGELRRCFVVKEKGKKLKKGIYFVLAQVERTVEDLGMSLMLKGNAFVSKL